MAPARTVSLKKPEIRNGRCKTILEGCYVTRVESKAASNRAARPSRNGQSPARRPEGGLHGRRFARGVRPSELCPDERARASGLSVCQNRKLRLRADARAVLASSPPPRLPITPPCRLMALWEGKWGALSIQATKTPCVTLTGSRRARVTGPQHPLPSALSPGRGPGQGHGNHLPVRRRKQSYRCASAAHAPWGGRTPRSSAVWASSSSSPRSLLQNECKTTHETYLFVNFLVKVKHST